MFVGGIVALLLADAVLEERHARETDPLGSLRATVQWSDARIALPAMVAARDFGRQAAISSAWFASEWFQTMLVLVLLLSGLHGVLAGQLRRFDT